MVAVNPLSETPEAFRYLDEGHARGKVVITLEHNNKMIGGSVLEEDWIEEVRSLQDENILFRAEGLLMYLPQAEVVGLFNRLSGSFSKSEIVFEAVSTELSLPPSPR